jgi:hypothetical protein
MPLLLAMFVLWAYICSSFVYKTWYLATAIALTTLAAFAARAARNAGVPPAEQAASPPPSPTAIRIDSLLRAVAPLILYFTWLLTTALWAAFPEVVVRWVAIDAIGIAVFILFYVAGRNARATSIVTALISILIPAMIVAAIDHLRSDPADPAATRLAPYAVTLLAILVPFLVLRERESTTRWPYRIAIGVTFALLILGRNRACLATALVLLAVSIVVFARPRDALVHAVIVAITIGVLLIVPATRTPVVALAARIARADVTFGGVRVAAQKRDGVRPTLARLSRELLPSAMPLGIGYMNMLEYSRQATGRSSSLHNMYMTFLLEGGLPCVAIVLFLAWRHARALQMRMRFPPDAEERDYAKALAIASVGVLLIGLVHQVQQSPAPFMLLALGAAGDAAERPIA